MVLVAELIEQLRPALEKEDPYDVWDYLKADAEKFHTDICIMALADLRQHFFELLFEKQFTAVHQLAATDEVAATKLLRQYFAEALVHFREDFICLLLKQDLRLDPSFAAWKTRISKVPLFFRETRWVDLYPTYQEVCNDPAIGIKERCLAEAISGQIILYSFPVFTQSEKHFQRAMELMPDSIVPTRCLGEFHLKKREYQKARELFLDVIAKQPEDYISYNLVGDTFFDETKIKLAQEQEMSESAAQANTITKTTLPKDLFVNEEYWYKEGWRINILQSESCRRLLGTYSFTSAMLAAYESKIPELLRIVEQTEWFPEKKRFRFTGENYASCFNDVTYYVTCKDLANSYQAIGDHAKAEKLFTETIQLQPQLSPAYIDLAYLKIKEKNYQAAKEQLDKALALDKDNYDTWWCLGYYYEIIKMKEEAIRAYQVCKQLRPFWSDWVDNFTGNVYFDYEEYELAIPCYRAAMTQNPEYKIYKDNLLLAQQKLADQKEKAGNLEEAVELHKQVAAETNAPLDWNRIGNFYYRHQRFIEAATYYAKAVALIPEEPVYHENLGLAYKRQGAPDKAEPEFLEAAKLNTSNGESMNQAGVFYYEQQQYDEALKWYRKALEKEPGHVDYTMNIGLIYEKKEDFANAMTWYEQAAKIAPGDDTIQNRMGLIYYAQGDHVKAIEYFQKAAALNTTRSVYLENIASSYTLLGKEEEAADYYRKAEEVNSGSDKAYN